MIIVGVKNGPRLDGRFMHCTETEVDQLLRVTHGEAGIRDRSRAGMPIIGGLESQDSADCSRNSSTLRQPASGADIIRRTHPAAAGR